MRSLSARFVFTFAPSTYLCPRLILSPFTAIGHSLLAAIQDGRSLPTPRAIGTVPSRTQRANIASRTRALLTTYSSTATAISVPSITTTMGTAAIMIRASPMVRFALVNTQRVQHKHPVLALLDSRLTEVREGSGGRVVRSSGTNGCTCSREHTAHLIHVLSVPWLLTHLYLFVLRVSD